jgi:hypothetical protein
MKRFVEGADRGQTTLLPGCLGDRVEESNPVRAVDVVEREAEAPAVTLERKSTRAPTRGTGVAHRRCAEKNVSKLSHSR